MFAKDKVGNTVGAYVSERLIPAGTSSVFTAEFFDGDTIDLLITFADGTVLSNTVKVVNHIEEYQPNVVTTSSPIGMAIYGKELGSVVDCQTPNGNIKIQIMGKALKEEQEETLGR